MARVQGATGAVASGTSYTITLSATPTSGNLIVLGSGNNQGALANVSQTGVTWGSASNAGFNFGTDIWVGYIGPGAGTVITVTLPVSGRGVGVADEWSGYLAAAALDQLNETHGTSTTIASSLITPTQDNCLVMALGVVFTTITGGPTGGFTNDLSPASSASFNIALAYLVQGTAAAAQATWSCASNAWDGTIISLLPLLDIPPPTGVTDTVVSSIVTDGFGSNHRPSWYSPQNRFGRLNSLGQPTTIAFALTGTPAEATLGAGSAADASTGIAAQAGLASGAGTAPSAAIANIAASPSAASGTGSAATASESLGPVVGVATATGAVQAPSQAVVASVGAATATGLAANAAIASTSPASVIAPAQTATATGQAGDIDGLVSVFPSALTGTGSAASATAAISPNGGGIAASGTAATPAVSIKANAGLAAGSGTAWVAADAVAVAAQAAAAAGVAPSVRMATEIHPLIATGTGQALDVLAAGPTVHGGPSPSIAMVVTIRTPLEIT